jgi:AcrR family transcriptional regulator
MVTADRYHHGDLRRALLTAAVQSIDETGPAALSLRDLARRAGVSHAAPAHHFGDKAGLLTAVAVEGYELLTGALTAAGDDILEMGVAYVRFAVRHRAHFEVMFRPDLYRAEAPEVDRARRATRERLDHGLSVRTSEAAPARSTVIAAWSIVHGFATLWSAGALPPELGRDPAAAARTILPQLFPDATGD